MSIPHLQLVQPSRALPDGSDEELWTLAASGRRDAFELLVRRYLEPIRRYCTKLSGAARLGEELTQDTFVSLWGAAGRHPTVGSFRKFAFTVATNACRNLARTAKRVSEREAAQGAPIVQAEELDKALAEVLLVRVLAEVGKLPEEQRVAVLLRYESGLSYAEISEISGCSEVTARSRVFLGLKKLRDQLKDEELDR
jgi:RNA polymerase sigma-70 factor (ECF subfamily)